MEGGAIRTFQYKWDDSCDSWAKVTYFVWNVCFFFVPLENGQKMKKKQQNELLTHEMQSHI